MVKENRAEQEIQRIHEEYARRAEDGLLAKKYTADNPVNEYIITQRHQVLAEMQRKHLPGGLFDLSILEVGCGPGGVLRELEQLGANPAKLFGLDLLQDRLVDARKRMEASSFVCGNGQFLPFFDASFDVVLQFTAFSSVLDRDMKTQMGSEMLRVLKPGGTVIWYDFVWNPTNRQTKGIPIAEVSGLFPGCEVYPSRITLAPPLAKLFLPKYRVMANWLTSLKVFNSHLLVFIQKPNKAPDL